MVGHPSNVKEKNVARIRKDLVGSVLITLPGSSDPIALTAGKKVPEGIELGAHVLEPEDSGDAGAQNPPPTPPASTGTDDAAKAAAKEAKKAAKKADKAQKAAAASAAAAAQPAPADASTPAPSSDALTPPPLNGAGSSATAWRDYALAATQARKLEIEIPEGSTRGDIIDALKSAGIPTE